MSEEPNSKQILNAHVDLSNVIEKDIIETTLAETFKSINSTLSDHCGPYGKYAMITPNAANPTAEPKFTKDGIEIVESIEYASIMQRYVNNTISYIGRRVERAGGDGTTSSMIIATKMLESLRPIMANENITFNDARRIYGKFTEEVETRMNEIAIKTTDESSSDDIYNIAYNQSMTSSHGDKELSKIIAALFKNTTRKSWDHISYECSTTETKNRYSLKTNDSDYSCIAIPYDNNQFNNDAGNAYSAKNTKLIISSIGIVLNSVDFGIIETEIKAALKNKTTLCIICPNQTDVSARMEIDKLLLADTYKLISIYSILGSGNNRINHMFAIVATFGHFYDKLNDEPLIIDNASIEFKDDMLYVSDVVTRTDNHIHPDFDNLESPAGGYMAFLRDELETLKKNRASWRDDNLEKSINEIHNTMQMQLIETLLIGGNGYDIQAAIPVVEDTLKASRAALLSGCVLGGFTTLRSVLNNIIDSHHDHITIQISKCFVNAIDTVRENTLKYAPAKLNSSRNGKKLSLQREADNLGGCLNVLNGNINYLHDITNADINTITQPLIIDLSLIKRFGEVAMKFIFTNRIIVPNGVMMEND